MRGLNILPNKFATALSYYCTWSVPISLMVVSRFLNTLYIHSRVRKTGQTTDAAAELVILSVICTHWEVFAPNVKPLDIVQCQTLGQSDCQVFIPVPFQRVGSVGKKNKFVYKMKRGVFFSSARVVECIW